MPACVAIAADAGTPAEPQGFDRQLIESRRRTHGSLPRRFFQPLNRPREAMNPIVGPYAMPTDDRFGFPDNEHVFPASPNIPKGGPEHPVHRAQGRPGSPRFRTATYWRRARTSRAVSVRLRKNTRAAASTVTRNETTDQPLYHGVTRHFRRSLDGPKLLTPRSIRFWLPTGHDALFQGYPGTLNAGHGACPIKTTGAKPDFIC